MKTAFFSFCALVAGLFIGWQSHKNWLDKSSVDAIALHAPRDSQQVQAFACQQQPLSDVGCIGANAAQERAKVAHIPGKVQRKPKVRSVPIKTRLVAYLRAQEYSEAIDLFSNVERGFLSADSSITELKDEIFKTIKQLLIEERFDDFFALIDSYLNIYYQDSHALMLLAQYNEQREFYLDAIGIYQLAFSYAKSQVIVQKQFQAFLDNSDKQLSKIEDWYSLLQFYETLADYELETPNTQLRKAEVLLLLNEKEQALAILHELQFEPGVAGKVGLLLKRLKQNDHVAAVVPHSNDYPGQKIPLKPIGQHFIVGVVLDEQAPLHLMIDTGASITSVSEAQFQHLGGKIDPDYKGQHFFRTANGVSRADIYRVHQFRIGNTILNDIDIAVLPNLSGYGLLGMNVLRNFRFEINQNEQKLWLGKR